MTATADDLVPEQLWQAIQPLLPTPPRRYGGRPRIDDRSTLVGIVYQLLIPSLAWGAAVLPALLFCPGRRGTPTPET